MDLRKKAQLYSYLYSTWLDFDDAKSAVESMSDDRIINWSAIRRIGEVEHRLVLLEEAINNDE